MSTQTTPIGHNRTGISTSPNAAKSMVEGTSEFMPLQLTSDENSISLVREEFAKDAEPLGSIPPPTKARGMANVVVQGIKGGRPTQFIDKLGERLAFERMGVRLYEALISKYEAFGSFAGGPELSKLEEMMLQEHEHFRILSDAADSIGADPTVVTPSADLHATLSKGIADALVDPRTTFVQCLDGVLIAELADNECWETLVELARQSGQESLVGSFERALAEENEHLAYVRTWIAVAQDRDTAA